ncbi:serine/threonine-protein phosphatase 6 regulatory ankyrin repeat subunit C-like [Sycon ciliatum]|uniref:serine/threonine-protein phosphatase 6 regulatory ankyrin repeat subunit C-like n=1 Tax=Sycon ciliatum TaxID=27933 RepID=UPI0020ACBA69|eukprot:scpid54438/ scgid15644/ Putative ankyrin repeat protein MM_0045
MDRQKTGELFRRIASNEASREELDEMLQSFPSDATIVDGFGFPAINSAAMHGNHTAIAALLDCGVDPHTRDPNGHTPLMIALRGRGDGFTRTVDAILEASTKKSSEESSDSGDWIHLTDNQDMTALHFAARSGDSNTVERLVALGADLQRKDSKRRTPLHYAALKARFHAVQTLLRLGSKVDATDNEGNTAAVCCALELPHVHEAAYRRRLSSVGDMNMPAGIGLTSEDKREEDWRRAVVEVLLAAGTEVDRANKWGQSLELLGKRHRWVRVALGEENEDSCSSQDSENGTPNKLRRRSRRGSSNVASLSVPQLRKRHGKLSGGGSGVQEVGTDTRNTPTPLRDSSVEDDAFDEVTNSDEKPAEADTTPSLQEEESAEKPKKLSWEDIKRTVKIVAFFVAARYIAFHVVGWWHSSSGESNSTPIEAME